MRRTSATALIHSHTTRVLDWNLARILWLLSLLWHLDLQVFKHLNELVDLLDLYSACVLSVEHFEH